MELGEVLKKTKKKRAAAPKVARAKPYSAVAERPYENDLKTETREAHASPKSSTSVVLALLSCFAHDALDEARTRATQAVTRVRDRVLKGVSGR